MLSEFQCNIGQPDKAPPVVIALLSSPIPYAEDFLYNLHHFVDQDYCRHGPDRSGSKYLQSVGRLQRYLKDL